jgi:hypothetical protein
MPTNSEQAARRVAMLAFLRGAVWRSSFSFAAIDGCEPEVALRLTRRVLNREYRFA